MLSWLQKHPKDKYIKLIDIGEEEKKRYRFDRLDLAKKEFNHKVIQIKKLGFLFKKEQMADDEFIIFSECEMKQSTQ